MAATYGVLGQVYKPEEIGTGQNISDLLSGGYIAWDANQGMYKVTKAFGTPPEPSVGSGSFDLEKFKAEQSAKYDEFTKKNQANTDKLIEYLKAQGEISKKQQEELNKKTLGAAGVSGYKSGIAQYAPEFYSSSIAKVEADGLQKLQELDTKIGQLILQAQVAGDKQEYDIFVQKNNFLEKLYAEQQKQIEQTNKDLAEKNKKLAEEADLAEKQDSIFKAILSQANDQGLDISGGIPQDFASDPVSLYATLNFGPDGKPTDANISFKDIFDVVDKVQSTFGKEPTSDIGKFNYAKSKGWIGPDVSYFDFLGMEDDAKMKDSFMKTTWNGQDALLNTKTGQLILSGGGKGTNLLSNPEAQPYLDAVDNLSLLSGFREDQANILKNSVLKDLEAGNFEQAKKKIELAAYGRFDTGDRNEFDLADVVKATSEQAFSFINQGEQGKDAIKPGPYKQFLNGKSTYLFVKKNPQLTELNFWIGVSNSQVRRAFFGTAVTVSEAGTANKFLISDNDDIGTIKIKLLGAQVFNDWLQEAKMAKYTGLTPPTLQDKLDHYGIDPKKLKSPSPSSIDMSSTIPSNLINLIGGQSQQSASQLPAQVGDYLSSFGY
jgi:hypothetical protein